MKVDLKKSIYATPPSPIVLVSTLDSDNKKNIAPFAFFSPCSHEPPMVAVGVREVTHTYKNAVETRDFVVGIPTPAIAENVYKAGQVHGDDEFDLCGLTPVPSKKVKSFRIKECQVNLECKFVKGVPIGDHTWMVGKIIEADVRDELFDEDKAELRSNLDTLYHITGPNFVVGKGKRVVVK